AEGRRVQRRIRDRGGGRRLIHSLRQDRGSAGEVGKVSAVDCGNRMAAHQQRGSSVGCLRADSGAAQRSGAQGGSAIFEGYSSTRRTVSGWKSGNGGGEGYRLAKHRRIHRTDHTAG